MPQAWCQQWEESEAGWGVRPDGYSLHLSQEDAQEFSRQYMENQQAYFKGKGVIGVPAEYTRPSGTPYLVEVTDEVLAELSTSRAKKHHGKSYTGSAPKPVGGRVPPGAWEALRP